MNIDPANSVPLSSTSEQTPPTGVQSSSPSLLDCVVDNSSGTKDAEKTNQLANFMKASSVGEALQLWFGSSQPDDKDRLVRHLNRDVALIDQLVNAQLNSILHHPAFQKLEASWRGLNYLVDQVDDADDSRIKVRALSLTWREVERDFDRALEFDQSELFQKIYENEFGMPGGEPFGVMLADYEIHPKPTAEHPHNDLSILESLAQVGAASFCPIITNANPAIFGLDDFTHLQNTNDHSKTFRQTPYLKWRTFRESEHARFVGLTMPRVLMRLPYSDDGSRVDGFVFQEDVSGPDSSRYLWGGAAYAMSEVLVRSFAQSGWLADIRGIRRGEERGGIVTGLPTHSFATDKLGIATKSSTDVVITDELEKHLSDLGFIPLCQCKDTEYSAYFSCQSVQKPKTYDRPIATVNARISSMLQYMFCVSRFAHYIKVIGREKTGSYTEASEFESYIRDWLGSYITPDSDASPDVKSRHPLREAEVQVYPEPGRPGCFGCTMHLAPHYELDELRATVRLQSELSRGRK